MEPIEPTSQIELPETQRHKLLLGILAVAILVALTFGVIKFGDLRGGGAQRIKVEKVPIVDGFSSLPVGFPADIPTESFAILEGATTYHLNGLAKQFSVSYLSAKTMAEKYAEYKNYMTRVGYTVTEEGDTASRVRALFGEKDGNKLSVVISQSRGETLVQVAYLLITR